jgi:23S rRNA pseudouridine1911/1915/1917 synthase
VASLFPERLDHYLVRLGWAGSRRRAYDLIGRGRVKLNGIACMQKARLVGEDDRVEVAEPLAAERIVPNPQLTPRLLFQNPSVLVVDKPAPIPCHPLRAEEEDTVMNGVVAAFPETAELGDNPFEGGLVHRLDNGTSGALIVARDAATLRKLRAALRAGMIRRRYLALVCGVVNGRLELGSPLAHHRRNPAKMVAVRGPSLKVRGKPRRALTIIEPLKRLGGFTLVAAVPLTGSRHQIRVHLAEVGYPLAGDTLYGGASVSYLCAGRFWLHLSEVRFDSPVSGPVTVTSPLPADLDASLDKSTRASIARACGAEAQDNRPRRVQQRETR